MALRLGDKAPDFVQESTQGTISNEEAATLFPQGYRDLKPYLRLTRV